MHDLLKLHHNCDAYMGVQKERKSSFLTAFEHREKAAHSLFAAQCWYRSCLYVFVIWELSIQYYPQIVVLVNRFYVLTTQFQ